MKIKDFIVGKRYYSTGCGTMDIVITVLSNDGEIVTADWTRLNDKCDYANQWRFKEDRLKDFNFIPETKVVKVMYET